MEKENQPEEHPHAKECSFFKDALKFEYLFFQNGEIQMLQKLSTLPNQEQVKVGNILTNEEYKKEDFLMGMVIKFCPFCSKKIEKIEVNSPLTDSNPFNDPNEIDFDDVDAF